MKISTVVSNLMEAPNTLTRMIFAYYIKEMASTGTIKIIVKNRKDGNLAGLEVFQNPYAFIGIKKFGNFMYATMVNYGQTTDSIATDSSVIYLRASAMCGSNKASFSYSFDNTTFKIKSNVYSK